MPITVDWFPEPLIRHSILTGVLTTADFEIWAQGELAIVNSHSHTVHFITDVRGIATSNVNMLKMNTVITFMRHANTGWIAVLGATPFVSFSMLMLQRIAGTHFMPFDSTEQAQTFLLELIRIAQEKSQRIDTQGN